MVNAFRLVREVRQELTGVAGMSDEELEVSKRRSIDRYGSLPETAEQQKQESHFYDDIVDAETASEGDAEPSSDTGGYWSVKPSKTRRSSSTPSG